jgi:hypothetical protein
MTANPIRKNQNGDHNSEAETPDLDSEKIPTNQWSSRAFDPALGSLGRGLIAIGERLPVHYNHSCECCCSEN